MFLTILISMVVSVSSAAPNSDGNTDLSPKICDQAIMQIPNILGKVESEKKLKVCHDSEFRTVVSEGCKTGTCELILEAKAQTEALSYSSRGTPGAWLCKKLGGKTTMVYFHGPESLGSKDSLKLPRIKTHICEKSAQFVSVDYLLSKMPAVK